MSIFEPSFRLNALFIIIALLKAFMKLKIFDNDHVFLSANHFLLVSGIQYQRFRKMCVCVGGWGMETRLCCTLFVLTVVDWRGEVGEGNGSA